MSVQQRKPSRKGNRRSRGRQEGQRRQGTAGTVGRQPRRGPTNPLRLAQEFLRRHGRDESGRLTLHKWGGDWWRYDSDRYCKVEDDQFRGMVTETVNDLFHEWQVLDRARHVRGVTASDSRNVINALESIPGVLLPKSVGQPAWLGEGYKAPSHVIAMRNKLMDTSGFPQVYTREHTPHWFSSVCLPYDFDPDANCSRWKKFLNEMFEGDENCITFLQEWFGYCLVADTSHHAFLMVVGPGANGKSVLLDILRAVVGPENCSSVALEDFQRNFSLASTIGKLVNIVSEVGDVARLPEGKLKAFVAGDTMTIDRKYREPLQVKPTARLVFATNAVPHFQDTSDGLWRRVIILPANRVVPPEKQDKQLTQRLMEELPGIFNWSLEGLRRLRQAERFSIPKRCEVAHLQLRAAADPVGVFLRTLLEEDPAGEVPASQLFETYQAWCKDQGHPQVLPSELGKALRRVFPNVQDRRRGSRDARELVYVGVRCVGGVSLFLKRTVKTYLYL